MPCVLIVSGAIIGSIFNNIFSFDNAFSLVLVLGPTIIGIDMLSALRRAFVFLIPSLTVPRAFLDPDGAFPHQWSLIPTTDRPLYVSVHSERVSPPPKS